MASAALIPFANPEIMAKRFAAGLSPVAAPRPARPAEPVPAPPAVAAAVESVGTWRPVLLALLAVLAALGTLGKALWLCARIEGARMRLIACKPILVPVWWLLGYLGATAVSFLSTMAIFFSAIH